MEMKSRLYRPKVVLVGIFGGLIVGVVSRFWMRWISTDPEFSWSGTIFIVGAFTIFFTTQSVVFLLRQLVHTRQRTTLIRVFGVIFSLPIFTAAGGIMFPAVALASIALWTNALGPRGRKVLLVLSLVIPFRVSKDIVEDFGWTFATVGRILLFIAIYTLVIISTRPTLSPYFDVNSEPSIFSRKKKILMLVGVLFIVALFVLLTSGIPGS